jgi:hypothetical protein
MAGAMLAAPVNPITVNLPYPVTVGSTTLPAGQYEMNSFEMGGEDIFVIRGEHTQPVTVRAQRMESDSDRTEVTLTKDSETWHLDKLTVAGEGEAFQFFGGK